MIYLPGPDVYAQEGGDAVIFLSQEAVVGHDAWNLGVCVGGNPVVFVWLAPTDAIGASVATWGDV